MTSLDALVIFAYFATIVGVGIRAGRGQTTMDGFALGDRRIPWWAVVASILAAEVSAATFLGAPVEGYVKRNFTYAQLGLGFILGRVVVGYVFVKPYFDFRVVSIYELLNVRFGATTKNAASAVFLVTRTLASGARLYAAALLAVVACRLALGRPLTESEELALYVVVLVILAGSTAVYTTIGGIKAVIWTDLIQTAVMYGGLAVVIAVLLHGIPGGWSGAHALLAGPRDLAFFDFGRPSASAILSTDYTLWSALLGVTFMTMATHGTDQDMVQRALTAKDHRQSRRALVLSGVADIPVMVGFLFVGILLFAYYRSNPDPGLPTKESEIFAYFILRELPSGIRGLLVAGVLATAMGSLSTALNALATSFTKDWYAPYLSRGRADDASLVRATRGATVVFAVALVVVGVGTAWAATAHKTRIIPIVLGVFGYTYGALLGVFLVGALTKTRGNERGNILAMITGFVVVSTLSIVGTPKVAFTWFVMLGTVVTASVAVCFRTPAAQIARAEEHVARARPLDHG